MRYIRYLFLAVVGICLITVALANRSIVTIKILPDPLAKFLPLGNEYRMPLFLVILGGILAGLLIGFIWEYFREYRQRADATRHKRKVDRLEREVEGLRVKSGDGKDDVLALLE